MKPPSKYFIYHKRLQRKYWYEVSDSFFKLTLRNLFEKFTFLNFGFFNCTFTILNINAWDFKSKFSCSSFPTTKYLTIWLASRNHCVMSTACDIINQYLKTYILKKTNDCWLPPLDSINQPQLTLLVITKS